MTSLARRIFRKTVPSRARRAIADLLGVDKDVGRVFSRIYREGRWGSGSDFYSGDGSHNPSLVEPYVAAMRLYLAELERPVHVVDIGCGDFNVGRQLVDCTDSYFACDIVPELIDRNRQRFKDPHVRFQAGGVHERPATAERTTGHG
jgi:SAM-dependent methyltransferase